MRRIIWILKYRVLIFFILFITVVSILVKGYFSHAVEEYVKYDCTNKINDIIFNSINDNVVANLTTESLMKVTYNNEKEVVFAYIDTQKTNEILTTTALQISELTEVFNDNGSSSIKIPVGYLFGDSVFFGSDFTLPIHISNISKYNIKLRTDVESYGINASLVTVNLVFDFSFKTMIPLITSDVFISNEVPLVSTILYGDVPNYFFEGTTPNISIS